MKEEDKALNELIKELRRQQAANKELLEALELAKQFISSTITKATGETE